jgi:hypothetical protein
MPFRISAIVTALLLLTPCLAGCGESSQLDDAAKARIAREEAAADDVKKSIGEEKYNKLASDGDEDGKGLPPHAVFSKMEQAKQRERQSKKAR